MPQKESEIVYYVVGGTLVLLTLTTYAIAFFDLGLVNVIVALLIAAAKGSIIAWFFMHVRNSSALTWVAIGVALGWLGILFSLTLSDYLMRDPRM